MNYDIRALQDRSLFHRAVRDYFHGEGFLETETPILARCPIPESHIELFRTHRRHPDGSPSLLHLLPSPELWMKLLLAAGAPSMFQIGRCFRNGEQLDRWHRLEFTMLEWYGIGASAADNIDRMQDLLRACTEALDYPDTRDVTGDIRRMTMDEAFRDIAGIPLGDDLRNAGLEETGADTVESSAVSGGVRAVLSARLEEKGLPEGEKDESADDLFHRLFLTLVEEELPADRPLVLADWPRLVPTLARAVPGTPWAERWELYVRGVEVANCYGEENRREELEEYWKSESALIAGSGGQECGENDWPRLVGGELPECSGAAVGLDRLLALIRGDDSLEGLDLFPINDMIRR